jgi:UDP-glucose 4-epimerase
MDCRVLVTGASGFIGRPLIAALADAGFQVRAATRKSLALARDLRIETVGVADFLTSVDWRPLLKDTDNVVHLAGIAETAPLQPDSRNGIAAYTREEDLYYDRVNRAATEELARVAARVGIRRFVYVSSIRAQTGPAADHIVTETDLPRPTEAYGSSKLAAERAVVGSGVNHTILRPVAVYGPNPKGSFRSLIRLAQSKWPLPLAAFKNRRSLLALPNLISSIEFALAAPAAGGQTYVVADPQALAVADIMATLRTAVGRSAHIYAIPPHLIECACAVVGCRDLWDRLGGTLVVNPGKLISAGWRPLLDTRTGLAQMMRGLHSVSTQPNREFRM